MRPGDGVKRKEGAAAAGGNDLGRVIDALARRIHRARAEGDFDELPEALLAMYRSEASQTLQAITDSGFRLSPRHEAGAAAELDPAELKTRSFGELFDLYRRRHCEWQNKPVNFLLMGEEFLQRSESVTAYEIFQCGIETIARQPAADRALHKRLLQRSAQALADAMALRESERILLDLYLAGARDGETMGLLAKVHKKLAIANNDPAQLRQALALYLEGFQEAERNGAADDAIYDGINAATMARLSGDCALSGRVVARVKRLCGDKPRPGHWDLASLGECCLLEGDVAGAVQWYRRAVSATSLRDRLSMRQQAHLICARLGMDAAPLERIFAPPRVLVFSGHRLDHPAAAHERFPARAEPQVREAISARIDGLRAGFAYCSAACGSDILFIEEMRRRKAIVHVYLPFPAEQFAAEFVVPAGEQWLQRFREALHHADSVTTVSHWDIGLNDKTHDFCNLYILGAALLQHDRTGCEIHGLAVWDGVREPGSSGTAAVLDVWRDYGLDWSVVTPAGTGCAEPVPPAEHDGDVERHVFLPMLFADVKGYSRLTGLQLYIFSMRFMSACAAVIDSRRTGIFATRTAGDGLFIVFRDLESAIDTARALRDMIESTDWSRSGLPADLSARFALDCGPCYSYTDPVTSRTELCGAHVIRAARLEPVTPPGHIYASESFAAMCATRKIGVRFEAAGRVVLPKNYGEMRVYHLH